MTPMHLGGKIVKPWGYRARLVNAVNAIEKTLLCGLLLISAFYFPLASAGAVAQPAQPTNGPGGADYLYAKVASHATGSGDGDSFVFWPEDAPKGAKLPTLVFTHGWGAMKPDYYQAWIDHLVRKGVIVIYPRYQAGLRTQPEFFTENAVAGVRKGLDWLAGQTALPQPDPAKWGDAGHSAGGLLAANLAVALPAAGLPRPAFVLSVEPGKTSGRKRDLIPMADMSKLPASTLLLVLTGQNDPIVGEKDGERIYRESTQIPASNKDWLGLSDDAHGTPALRAGHRAPCAPAPGFHSPMETQDEKGGFLRRRLAKRIVSEIADDSSNYEEWKNEPLGTDALDYYGTWKLLDALMDTAFHGKNRDIALGGGAGQLYMGTWSDGTPVKPLRRLSFTPAR